MSTTTTSFMNLVLPVPGSEPGPDWASELNTALSVVDAHDHTSGKGTQVPTAGILINADLSAGSYNITALRSTRYTSQSAALSLPSDISCLYVVNGNLYYNNSIGQQIQLTAGGALNASSIGAIGGDYATSTASLFYTSASSKFTFWSNTNASAYIDSGPLTIRNVTASSNGVTISPPSGLAANYSLTLPAALPASTSFMTVTSAGVMQNSISTTQGITQGMLAVRSVSSTAPSGGVMVTPSTASFVWPSTSGRSPNIVSGTLVTTGRPVWVGLVPDSPNAYLESATTGGNTTSTTFYISTGGTDIAFTNLATTAAGLSSVGIQIPVGSLYTIHFPAAGTQSYALALNSATAGTNSAVVNAKLVAYEL